MALDQRIGPADLHLRQPALAQRLASHLDFDVVVDGFGRQPGARQMHDLGHEGRVHKTLVRPETVGHLLPVEPDPVPGPDPRQQHGQRSLVASAVGQAGRPRQPVPRFAFPAGQLVIPDMGQRHLRHLQHAGLPVLHQGLPDHQGALHRGGARHPGQTGNAHRQQHARPPVGRRRQQPPGQRPRPAHSRPRSCAARTTWTRL